MTESDVAEAQAGLVSTEEIIVDAKSGVSGAGRSAKLNLLYTEIAEGINAYGVGSHRHMPEIEQVRDTLTLNPKQSRGFFPRRNNDSPGTVQPYQHAGKLHPEPVALM